MATRDEIIDIVLRRCGNRESDTTLTSHAEAEIVQIQNRLELEPELPWFLLTEKANATCTADEPRLPVPSNFLMEWDEGALYVLNPDDSKEYEVVKDEYDTLKAQYRDASADLPEFFALRKDVFWLFPTPDQAYTMYITYYKAQTSLTTNITNEWTTYAADLLIGELGIIMAGSYLHNPNLRAIFEQETLRARNRISAQNVSREEKNRTRTMGDE